MRIFRDTDRFAPERKPVLVALGTFDGVHLGHRRVIEELKAHAASAGGWAVATTFDPHPLTVISPPSEPFLLTTLDERLDLMAALEVDAVLVFQFTEAFRQITAEAFLAEMLAGRLGARTVFAGPHHTFGRDRAGTMEFLARHGRDFGIETHVVPPLVVDGTLVSSTHIRGLIGRGDVASAARLLGRRYAVRGAITTGDRRGARLGFPTANLDLPPEKIIPARGVYAAVAIVPGGRRDGADRWEAVVNVGIRPTFGGTRTRVEAHLLGFEGDLYGAPLEVAFVARLRDEQAFAGPEALVRQIRADIDAARRLLAEARVSD